MHIFDYKLVHSVWTNANFNALRAKLMMMQPRTKAIERERETRIKMVQWHIVLKLCSRFSMASHLNYVVDWFSKLVSSISSSAVRGSDAIRRYHSWKIEARLTLIGSTVIFHCHSSRKKKKTWRKKTLVVQMVCTTPYIYSLTRKKIGMHPLVFCGFIRGIIFYSHK